MLFLLLGSPRAQAQPSETAEPGPAQCQTSDSHSEAAFAASLVAEHDYYRAISVYKHLAFTAPNAAAWRDSMWQIANAYRASGRHEHAIHTLVRLRDGAESEPAWRSRVALGLGANYLGLRLPQVAQPFLDPLAHEPLPELPLLLAISEVQRGKLDSATSRLRPLQASDTNATQLQLAIDKARAAPRREPWVAGMLSAVIPGAGQLYAGHPVDALQAFAFVGAFGFASYIAFQYDRSEGNPYILTSVALLITALFHAANIIGAVRTATYHEQRTREDLIRASEHTLANIDLKAATPATASP